MGLKFHNIIYNNIIKLLFIYRKKTLFIGSQLIYNLIKYYTFQYHLKTLPF